MVEATLKLINRWFEKFYNGKRHLPTNFNNVFFFKGIFEVIKSEHAHNSA